MIEFLLIASIAGIAVIAFSLLAADVYVSQQQQNKKLVGDYPAHE